MKKLTREWVKKAEADHVVAVLSSRSAVPLHDAVCFHGQQCAEKYLKALLEELGLLVPKTHDLDHLLTLRVRRLSATEDRRYGNAKARQLRLA